MKFRKTDIDELEKLERVQLATSLPGAKPICLLGTQASDGTTNLAPFSSVTHLGSNPLLIGIVTRPATVDRHSLSNIVENREWTLNHVHSEILEQAHQCSARYQVSEFEATGLTPHYVEGIKAPFVAESRVRYSLALKEIVDITANETKLIVGEVTFIEIDDSLLETDYGINLVEADTLASTALDTYFKVIKYKKMAYAKP